MPSTTLETCPCGSSLQLSACCLPYIEGKKKPPTAEALLRSRYTAFARGEIDYVLSTHHTRTRDQVKREEIEDWARGSEWLGLQILQTEGGGEKDEKGAVAFQAVYRDKNQEKPTDHREYSLFERENGEWRFVDAHGIKTGPIRREGPKVGRNDPCSCGSGKKFKKCHGAGAA